MSRDYRGYDDGWLVKLGGGGKAHLPELDGPAHHLFSRFTGRTLCGLDLDEHDIEAPRRDEPWCSRCDAAAEKIDREWEGRL